MDGRPRGKSLMRAIETSKIGSAKWGLGLTIPDPDVILLPGIIIMLRCDNLIAAL
jgi:hypothetical protein